MIEINHKLKSLKLIVLFVPFLILATKSIQCQVIQADSVLESLLTDTLLEETNSLFYFDLSFTNNNINSTEYQAEQIPASLIDISYYHKSGIWLSITPVIYHNTQQFSYDLDFTGGIQKYFGSYFDANLYYTYHNYQGDSATQGVDYTHALNLSLGTDFSWLYLFAEGYVNFGKSNNYFADFGFAFYKELNSIFTSHDYISAMPLLSASFGTDYWFFDDYNALQTLLATRYINNNGYQVETFGYLGLDLIIPVSYHINNIDIGAAYMYNIPAYKYKKLDWTNQSGFMLSLSYTINLK